MKTKIFFLFIFSFFSVYPFSYDSAIYTAQKGDIKAADEQLRTIVVNSPDDADVLYDAGVLAYELHNHTQAAAYFNRAAHCTEHQDKSLCFRAHFNAGNVCVDNKELQRALEHYNEALLIEPDNEYALHNRDRVMQMLQEQEQQKQDDQKDQKNDKNQQDNKKDDKDQNKDDQSGDKNDQQNNDQQSSDQQKNNDQQEGDDQEKNDGSPQDGSDQQSQGKQGKGSDKDNKREAADEGDAKDQQQNAGDDKQRDGKQELDNKSERAQKEQNIEQDKKHEDTPEQQDTTKPESSIPSSDKQEQDKKMPATDAQDAQEGAPDEQDGIKGWGNSIDDPWLAGILDNQELQDKAVNKKLMEARIRQHGGKNGQNCW